tara:strand:+ start:388 stop:684 length:297 start_codon:yes stop_codon:yes gene_type:complete
MPSYNLAAQNGTQTILSNQGGESHHDVAIRADGAAQSGTITITARKPGSTVFESIPDATLSLSALKTIQFTGAVTEYKVNISLLSGVTSLYLTDTASK